MRTTIDISDELLRQAYNICSAKTKKELVEMGLQELIDSYNRRELAAMFGSNAKMTTAPRRR